MGELKRWSLLFVLLCDYHRLDVLASQRFGARQQYVNSVRWVQHQRICHDAKFSRRTITSRGMYARGGGNDQNFAGPRGGSTSVCGGIVDPRKISYSPYANSIPGSVLTGGNSSFDPDRLTQTNNITLEACYDSATNPPLTDPGLLIVPKATTPSTPKTTTTMTTPKKRFTSAKSLAKKLKNRNHLNLPRKLTHAGFGLGCALLNTLLPRKVFVTCMATLSASSLVMELLRYRKGFDWINQVLHFFLGSQLRKHEMEGKFTGSMYFFMGVTVTAATLPTLAASMGIVQLAIADPSASYFGQRTKHIYWSRIQSGLGGLGRNKGILGFLGGALFCVPFNYRALSLANWGAGGVPGGSAALGAASLILGLAGSFADLAVPTPSVMLPTKIGSLNLPPFHIDDNFVVPIFSGWACAKIFEAFGWSNQVELSKFLFL